MLALDISIGYAIEFSQSLARDGTEAFVSGVEKGTSVKFRPRKSKA